MTYALTSKFNYLLLFLIFLSFSSIFSGENSLPSLYVGDMKPRDRESAEYTSKIRSQVVTSILKYHRAKYNVLDDELVNQLAAKMAKLQKQGCDDRECRRALDLAINWDEKIVGKLQKDGEYFTLSLKVYEMNKDTYQPRVKGSVIEKFTLYQMDFFVNEMTRALMDLNYKPNYSRSPKKEGEVITEKNDSSFEFGKSFWGNLFFPGYNRLYHDDKTGYVLGSLWTASLIGIAATYPGYSNAKSSNSTWAGYSLFFPLVLPQGSETLGSYFVVNQMNGFYDEAVGKSQVINGLGGFAFLVWSYSWLYKPENTSIGLYRIPNSEWVFDFQIQRKAERGFYSTFENQYTLLIGRSFE